MSLSQSQGFNEAGLTGRLAYLDQGSGNARIRVYSGSRPTPGGTPSGTLLFEIGLTKPAGVVASNALTLSAAATETLGLATGTAAWGRVINGNGDWCIDGSVSEAGGGGEFIVSTVNVYFGGSVSLMSAVFG